MPDVSFPLAHLDGAEEMLCEVSPCEAGAMGGLGDNETHAELGWGLASFGFIHQ